MSALLSRASWRGAWTGILAAGGLWLASRLFEWDLGYETYALIGIVVSSYNLAAYVCGEIDGIRRVLVAELVRLRMEANRDAIEDAGLQGQPLEQVAAYIDGWNKSLHRKVAVGARAMTAELHERILGSAEEGNGEEESD